MAAARNTTSVIPEKGVNDRTMALVGFGIPFNEVVGHPREFLVADLPRQLAATMKGGRIAVRFR